MPLADSRLGAGLPPPAPRWGAYRLKQSPAHHPVHHPVTKTHRIGPSHPYLEELDELEGEGLAERGGEVRDEQHRGEDVHHPLPPGPWDPGPPTTSDLSSAA